MNEKPRNKTECLCGLRWNEFFFLSFFVCWIQKIDDLVSSAQWCGRVISTGSSLLVKFALRARARAHQLFLVTIMLLLRARGTMHTLSRSRCVRLYPASIHRHGFGQHIGFFFFLRVYNGIELLPRIYLFKLCVHLTSTKSLPSPMCLYLSVCRSVGYGHPKQIYVVFILC